MFTGLNPFIFICFRLHNFSSFARFICEDSLNYGWYIGKAIRAHWDYISGKLKRFSLERSVKSQIKYRFFLISCNPLKLFEKSWALPSNPHSNLLCYINYTGVLIVTVIVLWNGHGGRSSNPGRFTLIFKGKACIHLFPTIQQSVNSRMNWILLQPI